MDRKKFIVLSVEDNKADFDLFKEALSKIREVDVDLIHLQSGIEAIDFLLKKGTNIDAPTPDIIIIDINLPDISGFKILSIVKSNTATACVPVIVLSTSDLPEDIKKSYCLSANSYITKSFELKELFEKISTTAKYWFRIAELPSTDNTYFFCNTKE